MALSRTVRQNQYLEQARVAYAELRQQWTREPVNLNEAMQLDHNEAVEIHLDMLSVVTTGTLPGHSLLLKPGMFGLYLDSIGPIIGALLNEVGNKPDSWPRVAAFFKSSHFGTVPYHGISNALFGYLREQARSFSGKPANVEKQVAKNRGDMNDVGFISLTLPYVSDIMVDAKFADILNKPKMARYVKRTSVWSSKQLPELVKQAESDVNSTDFQLMDNLFGRLPPKEENEFVPHKLGERLIYGGVLY